MANIEQQFRRIENIRNKLNELNDLLSEAQQNGLNVTVVQRTEKVILPNGQEWPYGPRDLPEVVIQGHSMVITDENDDR